MFYLKYIPLLVFQLVILGKLGHSEINSQTTSSPDSINIQDVKTGSDAIRFLRKKMRATDVDESELMRVSKDELYNILSKFWQLYTTKSRDLKYVAVEDLQIIIGIYETSLKDDIESNYLSIPKATSKLEYVREAYKTIYQLQETEIGQNEDELLQQAVINIDDPKERGEAPKWKSSNASVVYASFNLFHFGMLLVTSFVI